MFSVETLSTTLGRTLLAMGLALALLAVFFFAVRTAAAPSTASMVAAIQNASVQPKQLPQLKLISVKPKPPVIRQEKWQ